MGIFYIAVSLFIVITHLNLLPGVIVSILKARLIFLQFSADLQVQPSCRGVKRGLFSNEAGVGSAPNAQLLRVCLIL